MKFEITFRDEIDADNIHIALQKLDAYLQECVKYNDFSAFGVYEMKNNEEV